jgi:hypothetical protein
MGGQGVDILAHQTRPFSPRRKSGPWPLEKRKAFPALAGDAGSDHISLFRVNPEVDWNVGKEEERVGAEFPGEGAMSSMESHTTQTGADPVARFERAWKDGARPIIEEYLGPRSEPSQQLLLGQLLSTELRLRLEAGEEVRSFVPGGATGFWEEL